MKLTTSLVVTLMLIAMMTGVASAVPRLQTYIVGSQYQNFYRQEFQSWITNSNNFDLKVVGSWESGGPAGTAVSCLPSHPSSDYLDCFLMMSVPKHESGTIWINGIEMTGFGNFGSAVPESLHPGLSLHYHMPATIGAFGFADLGRIDNSRMNAHDYTPTGIGSPGWGDEILVSVVVSGYSWVHFDAVGVDSRGKTYMNPTCRDGSFYATPEPGTLSLLGLGLLGMIPLLRRKKD